MQMKFGPFAGQIDLYRQPRRHINTAFSPIALNPTNLRTSLIPTNVAPNRQNKSRSMQHCPCIEHNTHALTAHLNKQRLSVIHPGSQAQYLTLTRTLARTRSHTRTLSHALTLSQEPSLPLARGQNNIFRLVHACLMIRS